MIQCKNYLAVVIDLGGADGHELEGNRPSVVVRHAVVGFEGDIVAGPDLLSGSETDGVLLDNLLGEGLRVDRSGRLRGGEEVEGIRGTVELRLEGVLPQRARRGIGTELRDGGGKRS